MRQTACLVLIQPWLTAMMHDSELGLGADLNISLEG